MLLLGGSSLVCLFQTGKIVCLAGWLRLCCPCIALSDRILLGSLMLGMRCLARATTFCKVACSALLFILINNEGADWNSACCNGSVSVYILGLIVVSITCMGSTHKLLGRTRTFVLRSGQSSFRSVAL